jgi:hypothetical protein
MPFGDLSSNTPLVWYGVDDSTMLPLMVATMDCSGETSKVLNIALHYFITSVRFVPGFARVSSFYVLIDTLT